jgi:hypothetical protein
MTTNSVTVADPPRLRTVSALHLQGAYEDLRQQRRIDDLYSSIKDYLKDIPVFKVSPTLEMLCHGLVERQILQLWILEFIRGLADLRDLSNISRGYDDLER